jgi:hypothetical protein
MAIRSNSLASQKERIELAQQGFAVVANARKGKDETLLSWAHANSKLTPVGEDTVWKNPHQPKR